ncbi:MAG: metallophosphoesterase [Chlorobi bacterium]|nr:metallophosphoesterase [Chlorobiota bacterium]
MRSISHILLIIVPILLILLSGFSFISLKQLLKQKRPLILKYGIPIIYWGYSLFIVFYFIYLFIYPKSAATSTNYSAYFFFNIILITDLVVKLVMTLVLIPYYFLRLFKINRLSFIWSGVVICVGVVLTVIFGATAGTNQIRVEKVEIGCKGLPDAFNGLKIIQLSDIHLGSFNGNHNVLEKAIEKINALQPDLILFTGDLVNNFSYELDGYKEVFKPLVAKLGKYSILGNHDYGDYFNWEEAGKKLDNFNKIEAAHAKFGFTLLENNAVPIINAGDTIFLVGVENWGHPPFPQYANLDKALEHVPAGAFKILLTHDPAHWESKVAGKRNIQLTLSGHTHGAQLGVNVAGVEFSPIYFTRERWGGLYRCQNQYLYVNRGLGTIGLNFRIDMLPEITEITLTKN